MKLISGEYTLSFKEGGVEVQKNNKLLYFNKRPMSVTVKTVLAVSEFYDEAYSEIAISSNIVIAKGILTVPSGSEFSFADVYETTDEAFLAKT